MARRATAAMGISRSAMKSHVGCGLSAFRASLE